MTYSVSTEFCGPGVLNSRTEHRFCIPLFHHFINSTCLWKLSMGCIIVFRLLEITDGPDLLDWVPERVHLMAGLAKLTELSTNCNGSFFWMNYVILLCSCIISNVYWNWTTWSGSNFHKCKILRCLNLEHRSESPSEIGAAQAHDLTDGQAYSRSEQILTSNVIFLIDSIFKPRFQSLCACEIAGG